MTCIRDGTLCTCGTVGHMCDILFFCRTRIALRNLIYIFNWTEFTPHGTVWLVIGVRKCLKTKLIVKLQ